MVNDLSNCCSFSNGETQQYSISVSCNLKTGAMHRVILKFMHIVILSRTVILGFKSILYSTSSEISYIRIAFLRQCVDRFWKLMHRFYRNIDNDNQVMSDNILWTQETEVDREEAFLAKPKLPRTPP